MKHTLLTIATAALLLASCTKKAIGNNQCKPS